MIEVGKTYNAWKVLEDLGSRDVNGHKRHFYLCKCVCGKQKEVRSDNLTSGHSNGCGCLRKKLNPETWKQKSQDDTSYKPRHGESIIGKTFGDLEVLDFAYTDKNLHAYFKCQCSCGRIEDIRGTNLRVDHQVACSECLKRISNGELAVRKKLESLKVKFREQVTFDELVGDVSKLRFDFVVYDDEYYPIVAIEFQGHQHYEPIDFFGGQTRFEQQQRYDNKKREFCKENGIKLIEIPYDYKDFDSYFQDIKI